MSDLAVFSLPVVEDKELLLSDALELYFPALVARNLSPRTIDGYGEALGEFQEFLASFGIGECLLCEVKRAHVEGFIDLMLRRKHQVTGRSLSPATASNRYRALHSFFNWCVDNEYLHRSPMLKMRGVKVPEQLVPVLSPDTVKRLLAVCMGRDFRSRRDAAMIAFLYDSGVRRAEFVSMSVSKLDMQDRSVPVLGKGGSWRPARFGEFTASLLVPYLERRDQTEYFDSDALWVGHQGPLTGYGLRGVISRRASQAGLSGIHPHLFRHSFAHEFLYAGGQESDLVKLLGWNTPAPQMLRRYGASAAVPRAKRAHGQFAPGDRLR